MLQVKIGESKKITIDSFMETKDFIDRPDINTLRIEFENAAPLGEDSIGKLTTIFQEVPYLVIMEDDVEIMNITGTISLFRITREARRKRVITTVQLTYYPSDIIE